MTRSIRQASRVGLVLVLAMGVTLSAQAAPLVGPMSAPGLSNTLLSATTVQYQKQRYGKPGNKAPRQAYQGGNRGCRDGNPAGAAVAAGVAGLVVGGIIASQRQREYRTYEEPYPAYGQRYQPVYSEPQYVEQSYAPAAWTQEWYDYCAGRYRSFDPRSGTFVGYDGRRYMCQ
jgi:hypothetical protein